jgi:hypothetical protein
VYLFPTISASVFVFEVSVFVFVFVKNKNMKINGTLSSICFRSAFIPTGNSKFHRRTQQPKSYVHGEDRNGEARERETVIALEPRDKRTISAPLLGWAKRR